MENIKERAPRGAKKVDYEKAMEEAWEARFEEEKRRVFSLPREEGWGEGEKALLWCIRSLDIAEEMGRFKN